MQVTTRGLRPVLRLWSSSWEEIKAVVNSVSAAVPAPAHQIWGEMKCNFSQFLSATIGPLVALVSAAITTPPSKIHPTMVVPVEVALGKGIPFACSAALRV